MNVRGIPIGEIELDGGDFKLRFKELDTFSNRLFETDESCETRRVEQGEPIGNHHHYLITALAPDGSPLSVAVSEDSTLYAGEFAGALDCPCLVGN